MYIVSILTHHFQYYLGREGVHVHMVNMYMYHG